MEPLSELNDSGPGFPGGMCLGGEPCTCREGPPPVVISRSLIPFQSDRCSSEMIVERWTVSKDSRLMLVHVTQPPGGEGAALTIELLQTPGREFSVRGSVHAGGEVIRYFEGLPPLEGLPAESSQKARAWWLIDTFLEHGAGAACAALAFEPRDLAADTLLEISPQAVPVFRQPRLSAHLPNGTIILLFEDPAGFSINISHVSRRWGDQLVFSVPSPKGDELALKIMENFFTEISSADPARQNSALADLSQYTSMECGSFELLLGARHSLAHLLHQKLHPLLGRRLASWKKGPFRRGSALAGDMLIHGLEFETLRRRSADYDLFSEMELALAPSLQSPHSRFTVRNALGLEARFKLPPADSMREWLKRMEAIVRCFITRPEALLERYAAWLDAAHTSPWAADPGTTLAFRHIFKVMRAAAAAARRLGLPPVASDVQSEGGAFCLVFRRESGACEKRRLWLSFAASAEGLSRLSVSRSCFGVPLRRVFRITPALPNVRRLQKIFELFYAEEPDSPAALEESALCRWLAAAYRDETPALQNTACRLTSFAHRLGGLVDALQRGPAPSAAHCK